MIFESHAHYEDDKFNEDRDEVIASLVPNGIDTVVNVGSSVASCHRTVELSQKYDFIYAALGFHPEELCELEKDKAYADEAYKWLESELRNDKKVVAVGEIGLDYYWDSVPVSVQQKWFERQIELAAKVSLPMIIHSRDAAKDTYDIMRANRCGEIGGVVHCFSYSKEEASRYLDMGFYIGVGGVVTFKNARKMKEVVEYTPLDRILLETDCPYLAPEPNRGKRNSSLNLKYVAQAIADIKGVTYDEVVEATGNNARKMYRI